MNKGEVIGTIIGAVLGLLICEVRQRAINEIVSAIEKDREEGR